MLPKNDINKSTTRDVAFEGNLKHHPLTWKREARIGDERDSSARIYRKQKGRQSMMSTRDDESF